MRQCLQAGLGYSPEEAERVAVAALEAGADAGLAGERFYWPAKVRTMSKEELHAAIRREFNGSNVRQLIEKYQVGKTTVYRVTERDPEQH